MTRLLVVVGLLASLLDYQPAPPALRIVVLEGEDAVNVIQQKTAVRPLIEVRDRNNLPVAGATVTFTIGAGQPAAFAGGVQTLTVTTNAAGQAAAGGLNAISSGAFQIQVQAAYQGQIATVAISQTNFATAAAATQAGAASGAGGTGGSTSGATTGAAGGGGGISGTTVGIAGAAVAAGAVAATQLGGSDGDSETDTANTNQPMSFSGTFNGPFLYNTVTRSDFTTSCVSTRTLNGTLTITLRDRNTTGEASVTGTRQEVSVTGSPTCVGLSNPTLPINVNREVTGAPANIEFLFTSSNIGPTPSGSGSVTVTETVKFQGSLSDGVITGTLVFESAGLGSTVVNGVTSTITNSGSASFPVTLR